MSGSPEVDASILEDIINNEHGFSANVYYDGEQ
jgi:hypothetical protein